MIKRKSTMFITIVIFNNVQKYEEAFFNTKQAIRKNEVYLMIFSESKLLLESRSEIIVTKSVINTKWLTLIDRREFVHTVHLVRYKFKILLDNAI